ncbi:MAG: hypothetical protein K2X93_24830 [Candidatus Obscuribacterales bacterium]|nr:hypothetical protein [Candidatus Obscuribacterales bacterium]
MNTKNLGRIILSAALIAGVSVTSPHGEIAFAQSGSTELKRQEPVVDNTPTRLRRPGTSQGDDEIRVQPDVRTNSDGRPFSLGVEKKEFMPGDEVKNLFPPTAPSRLNAGVGVNGNPPFPLGAQQSDLSSGTTSNGLFGGASGNGLFGGTPGTGLFGSANSNPPLSGNATTVRLLADYDIELIIDQSLSMQNMDCPGGLSRWDWVGVQTRQMASQLAPFVPRGLTLTTFASEYKVYPNASPGDITQIFRNPNFSKGTRLSGPVRDRLGNYLQNRGPGSRPVLIGVITDGVPIPRTERTMVADSIIAASNRMRDPRDITVVFFQIGTAGRRFLVDVDNNLVSYGARHDIVRVIPFERLVQVGFAQGLVDAVREFASRNRDR